MKIVFVNSCPYLGGAEKWHLRTAEKMKARGHQVRMVARTGPLAHTAIAAGIPTLILPLAFDLDLFSFFRAWSYLRKEKPDLLLLNDQRECRIIAPAGALAGVKVRVQRKGWPFLKGSFRDRIVYRYFITHLFAPSEAVAKVFREKSGLPPAKIRVIPNSVAPDFFEKRAPHECRRKFGLPEKEPTLGFAGRLVSQKGIDILIQALAQLKEKGFLPWAIIAGEGEEKERLKNMAIKQGVAERVKFCGQVADMPAFLASLDLFVFPSRQEGKSNALAEAMATGLPIIATNIPGNDELIQHEKNGLLVPPEDPQTLAQAMQKLLSAPELARQLGATARAYAEEHLQEESLLAELENYLESLLQEGKA